MGNTTRKEAECLGRLVDVGLEWRERQRLTDCNVATEPAGTNAHLPSDQSLNDASCAEQNPVLDILGCVHCRQLGTTI